MKAGFSDRPAALGFLAVNQKYPIVMKILDIPQSGKKGLNVSMNGRYGQVRRTLVIPTNPRTPGPSDRPRSSVRRRQALAHPQ